jgi:hypothetical protein
MAGPSIDASFQISAHLAKQIKINNPFIAHLAKGNVSFCHHLASVVCRPLTFHILIFFSKTT